MIEPGSEARRARLGAVLGVVPGVVLVALLGGAAAPAAAQEQDFRNINPAFSPDGGWLVYEGREPKVDEAEIRVMKTDGSESRRLTFDPADDTHPSFSPDGGRILFDSDRGGMWNLYTMAPDGADVRALIEPPPGAPRNFARHPRWSPDGRWIAFDSEIDGDPEIYLLRLADGALRRVTRRPAADSHPSWAPDGRRLVFTSKDGDAVDIYRVDLAASLFGESTETGVGEPRRLTFEPGLDGGANWSPRGDRIAFFSNRDGGLQIYTMDPDGGDLRRLTSLEADVYELAWSPDADRIAFYSNPQGIFEIHLMHADGSHAVRLTNSPPEEAENHHGASN